ncbi:uncharacterized protein VP01_392g3 [Puccinia sorghi]|uniref:Uncharacterized protein n=1 Tax=Puccinia sorghi TaxID=27349 RepID=A0A0L6UTD2_9BASI|nr:uncharacterized protein VP01_392g3 [Puccinia sorghi]
MIRPTTGGSLFIISITTTSNSLDPTTHTENRRLTQDLYEEIRNLINAGLKPFPILQALKKTFPEKNNLSHHLNIGMKLLKFSQNADGNE